MDLITYKQHLATLIKSPSEILDTLNPYKVNLLHMVIGLTGELAELAAAHDKDNYLEEFGDSAFYLTGTKMALDTYPEWVYAQSSYASSTDVDSFNFVPRCYKYTQKVHWKSQCVIVGGEILDMIKKHCIYNKPITSRWCYDMAQHIHALEHLLEENAAECEGWTVEDVRIANIVKLAKRYPELNYTDTAAQERADKVTDVGQAGQPEALDVTLPPNVAPVQAEDRRIPPEVPIRERGTLPDDVQ